MKKVISKEGIYAIASETINQKTPEVVTLMQGYGMDVSQNDSKGKIDKASALNNLANAIKKLDSAKYYVDRE